MIGPGSAKEIIMNSLSAGSGDERTEAAARCEEKSVGVWAAGRTCEKGQQKLKFEGWIFPEFELNYPICRWSKSIHIKVSALCLMSQVVQHLLVESKDLMDLYLTRYHWFNLTSWLPNCGYCSNKCFRMRWESHIKYNFAPPIWYTLVTGMDCPTQLVLSDPSPIIALPCYSLSQ